MEASFVAVTLTATISPSEDPSKVLSAARNVLGDCDYQVEEGRSGIILRSRGRACLQRIHDQFRDRHVRAAANRLMLRSQEGHKVTVFLNRQAAAAGIVVLCTTPDESPLGPLVLEIESSRPEALIEWLTAY